MGKRITSQARGKGSVTFRVRRKGYKFRIAYPPIKLEGAAKVLKLVNSSGHSCPLAKIQIQDQTFYNPATQGIYEGQEIMILGKNLDSGNIIQLKEAPLGTRVFNIEKKPGDGGKIARSGGTYGTVTKKEKGYVTLLITNKREIVFNENVRATVGACAGQGRVMKPLVKAGKQHHIMKSKGRKWHRTSAVKVNAIDHPFGGGRGKRIKSKIAKRNSPPGRRVGHLRPRRTGKR